MCLIDNFILLFLSLFNFRSFQVPPTNYSTKSNYLIRSIQVELIQLGTNVSTRLEQRFYKDAKN